MKPIQRPRDQIGWSPATQSMPSHVREAIGAHIPMRPTETQARVMVHGTHVKKHGYVQPNARVLATADEDTTDLVHLEAVDFSGADALVTVGLTTASATVLLRAIAQALREQGISDADLTAAVTTHVTASNTATYYREEERSND